MAEIVESITDAVNDAIPAVIDYAGQLAIFILLIILGYVAGTIVGGIAKRLLRSNKLQGIFIKYGAMTSGSWSEITNFLGQYVKWLIVIFVLSSYYTTIQPLSDLLYLAIDFLVFIVLLVVGWVLAGVLYKIIREVIENIGIEKGLKKYGVADAVGGIDIPHIVATLIKLYVFLLFAWQGVAWLGLEIFGGFMGSLMDYIPNAILGLLIIVIALVVADFTGDRLKKRKVAFASGAALVAEVIIVIIGVTLALPKFGFEDIGIIKWSFIIIILCMGIGLAIAMGLGLKDSFSRIGKKYEKDL